MPSIALYNATPHDVQWRAPGAPFQTALLVPSGQVSTATASDATYIDVCASEECSVHDGSFHRAALTHAGDAGDELPVGDDVVVRVVRGRQHGAQHVEVYPASAHRGDVTVVNGTHTPVDVSAGMWGGAHTLGQNGDAVTLQDSRGVTLLPSGDQSIQFTALLQQGALTSPSGYFVVHMHKTGGAAWTATITTAHDAAKNKAPHTQSNTVVTLRNSGAHALDFVSDDPNKSSVRLLPQESALVPGTVPGTLRVLHTVTHVPNGLLYSSRDIAARHNVTMHDDTTYEFHDGVVGGGYGGGYGADDDAASTTSTDTTGSTDSAASTPSAPAPTSTNPTFKDILKQKVAAYAGLGLAGTGLVLIIASIVVYSVKPKDKTKSKTPQAMLMAGVGLIALAAGTVLLVHAYMRAQDKLKTAQQNAKSNPSAS